MQQAKPAIARAHTLAGRSSMPGFMRILPGRRCYRRPFRGGLLVA
jgi:hypothetical protein